MNQGSTRSGPSAVSQLTLKILAAAGRVLPVRGIPILYYHSVMGENQGSVMFHAFCDQMHYLHEQGYRVVSLDKAVELLNNGRSVRHYVALTFDDGFRSVFTHAFPILKRYGFPATVFVSTDYIGGRSAWDPTSGLHGVPILAWDEIRVMHGSGIRFGSHTCSHPNLTRLPRERAAEEMTRSKDLIEERLGEKVDHIAYPYGAYNPAVLEVAAECGFRCGFTINPGINRRATSPLEFRRAGVFRDTDHEAFKCRLTPAYGWYFRLKGALLERTGGSGRAWETNA